MTELRRGWPALVAAFLGIAFGVTSLFFYTSGVFMKPIALEFGWTRAELSTGSLFSVLSLAAIAPFCGAVVDRIGVRAFTVVSLLGLALAFFLMSRLPDDLTAYFALTVAISVVAAGTTPVPFTRLINQWFDKARGLALGIALCGTGIAAAVAPRVLAGIVEARGWRFGYVAMAIAVACVAPIVAWLLGRKSNIQRAQDLPSEKHGMTFRAAVRTMRFWVLAIALLASAAGSSAIIVHMIPMLTDAGLTPQRAAATAALIGIAVIISRVAAGAAIDRIFAPYVAVALFTTGAFGCFVLAGGGPAWAPLAAVLVGFAIGAEADLIGYVVYRYFGMRAYGVIYGSQYTAFLIGIAFGPLFAGAVFDRYRAYTLALVGAGVALTIAATLMSRLGPFPLIGERE